MDLTVTVLCCVSALKRTLVWRIKNGTKEAQETLSFVKIKKKKQEDRKANEQNRKKKKQTLIMCWVAKGERDLPL